MALMEQKMGQARGLTSRQEQFLGLVLQEPYVLKNFYLSGGTALSSWYLHHRESNDLDFFSNQPFDYDHLSTWLKTSQKTIGYHSIVIDEDFGFMTTNLRYSDGSMLKIDFNRYAVKKVQPGLIWKGLEIDSLYDITVNKLSTISSRARTRDYVDLYFIFQKHKFDLDKLVSDVRKKFSEVIDPLLLTKNFLKVVEYTDYPKMLVPFDKKSMENFYEDLAKQLKPKILK